MRLGWAEFAQDRLVHHGSSDHHRDHAEDPGLLEVDTLVTDRFPVGDVEGVADRVETVGRLNLVVAGLYRELSRLSEVKRALFLLVHRDVEIPHLDVSLRLPLDMDGCAHANSTVPVLPGQSTLG